MPGVMWLLVVRRMEMKKNSLLMSFLLILSACTSSYGQDSRPLEQKIADAVMVYQPGLILRSSLPAHRIDVGCDLMAFEWVRGDVVTAQAFLWVYDSEEAVAAKPREILGMYGPAEKDWPLGANEKPEDGKEYSWTKEYSYGVKMPFRLMKKGKTVILVTANTQKGAAALLKLIVSEVTAT